MNEQIWKFIVSVLPSVTNLTKKPIVWIAEGIKKHYAFMTRGETRFECNTVCPYEDMPGGEEMERKSFIIYTPRKMHYLNGLWNKKIRNLVGLKKQRRK